VHNYVLYSASTYIIAIVVNVAVRMSQGNELKVELSDPINKYL